jgi:hypothetical protein
LADGRGIPGFSSKAEKKMASCQLAIHPHSDITILMKDNADQMKGGLESKTQKKKNRS